MICTHDVDLECLVCLVRLGMSPRLGIEILDDLDACSGVLIGEKRLLEAAERDALYEEMDAQEVES